MESAYAADSPPVDKTPIKQEPGVNVYEVPIVMIKPEFDDGSQKAQSRDTVGSTAPVTDFTVKYESTVQIKPEPIEAEISLPADRHPATSSTTSLTDNDTPATPHIDTKHKNEKRYSCNYCDYQSAYRFALTKHIRTHTGERPYACTQCDYRCSHAQRLKLHMMTHTGEKPFSCTHCDYKCSQAQNLKSHMMTHTGEKPHSCERCDYKCVHPRDLKLHMMTHTGEKPFSCDHCEYKCSDARRLKIHTMTHTGEKRFSCNRCDRKFTHSCNVKKHIAQHSCETPQPHYCKHCDYKCTLISQLKTHLKIHFIEKLYSCDRCDYKCPRSHTLKTHMATHTGEKPYSCTQCDYKCAQASNLKRHMKKCSTKSVNMRHKTNKELSNTDNKTEADVTYEFVACKTENVNTAESMTVQGKLLKQEPLDPDYSKTCINMFDDKFEVKQEVVGKSLEKAQLRENPDALSTATGFTVKQEYKTTDYSDLPPIGK